MKKLVLAGCLAIIGCVAAPVATASAAEAGGCTFEGEVTFGPGQHLGTTPKQMSYKFINKNVGGAVGNECKLSGGNRAVTKAEVNGEGELSCGVSQGVVGIKGLAAATSNVKVEGRTEFSGPFKFAGAGATVGFAAEGTNSESLTFTAAGQANFLKNAGSVAGCVNETLASLNFEATATAAIK
jgi:hypothetical protein